MNTKSHENRFKKINKMSKTILFCIVLLILSFNAKAIKVKFIVANTPTFTHSHINS